jgi:alpha-galactosidase
MPKAVIVGAGSLEFSSRLSADLLSFPALTRTHFALVDADSERLEFAARILERIFLEGGYQQASYSPHAERSTAFEGADYVIISILIGGYPAIASEIDIPGRYGVDQAIGDTLTPGGIMRCLRTLPELCAIADDVMAHCPKAWVLNYTNPMAMLCWGMKRALPDLNLVGLCHSVQHTSEGWARRLHRPIEEIEFMCAGLNHQAWLLKFQHNGANLIPKIRRLALEPRIYRKDTSRREYIKHFGYPATEASGHNSEYSPWFRKRPELIAQYCPGGGWNGGSGFIKELYDRPDWRNTMRTMADGETELSLERRTERGAPIVHAIETDARTTIHGNVMNEGLIDNLAADACVEVRCEVDGSGIQARRVGELPTHLAAINQNQINVQRLAVDAAMTADPERVFQAMAMDPLTGAVCSLDEIRALTRDLLEAHRPWLPVFDNRPLANQPVLTEPGAG